MSAIKHSISILLRCDGGPMHGFGHVSRCVTLAKAFASGGYGIPIFQTFSPDGVARKFITDHGFAVESAPAGVGSVADFDSLRARLRKMASPRLFIVDSRDADSHYCRSFRDLAVVLCLDDEVCRDLDCDILVNNHPWISDADYPPRSGRTLLTGSGFNMLSPDSFRKTGRNASSDVQRILITLGGEDPHNHTSWIVKACSDLLLPYAVDIVVGPAHPDPHGVEITVARCLPSANLMFAPSGLERLIQDADIAISAGGITCYELAAARVPVLAILVEDHQDKLLASLAEHGCLMRLGAYDNLQVERVRQMLSCVLADKKLRDLLATAGSTLFERPGGPAIAAKAAEIVDFRFPGSSSWIMPSR